MALKKNRNLGGPQKKCHKPQSSKRQKVVVLRGLASDDALPSTLEGACILNIWWYGPPVFFDYDEAAAAALVMLHAILTLSAFIELNYKGMDAR